MTTDLADPAALAASVRPSTRAVIGGRSVDAASGKTFATLDPATGRELAQVAECDAVDVDRAVTDVWQKFVTIESQVSRDSCC